MSEVTEKTTVALHITSKFDEKVKRITSLCATDSTLKGKEKSQLWQVISDFDHTLTHPESNMCHNMISELCPNENLQKVTKQLLVDCRQANVHKGHFWEQFHTALLEHKFEKWMIDHIMDKTILYLRDFVKEIFVYCGQQKIPILVISAGIENIIEQFLWNEGLLLEHVKLFSNRLVFEDDKHIQSASSLSLSRLKSDDGKGLIENITLDSLFESVAVLEKEEEEEIQNIKLKNDNEEKKMMTKGR
ncbi:hypothetical protein RFI_15463 [Reticulomyxa filosa]|uniref:5'-nucleotidase n=1 Tax=Reticulomyxa filosa TaxID=46433 RepID=X6N7K6_RETFI|nr:hypothetical protein RFI_15463 [Reticulomyxa filosa]|eukprot:ETO21739.1 hypothetical protein RFI_15463 [Reticulomyxa filosa]